MIHYTLAASFSELVSQFDLRAEAFIAHFIAFAILVAVVVCFGIKPVMSKLEERRRRIEEGEAMHARSERELALVKQQGEEILVDARNRAKDELEHTRRTAEGIRNDIAARAQADAATILNSARRQAEEDARRQEQQLKSEFMRLVALATEHVTGKVLTDADHRVINAEAIRRLSEQG